MELPNNISDCHKIIKQQFEMIASLLDQVHGLQARVSELDVRLNQNSQNSSKPPSSDQHKPKRKPGIKRTKKSRGGQKGHTGNTLKMVEQADNVQQCKPTRCSCGKRLASQPMDIHARRQVFDLPEPKLKVTEFRQFICSCPDCGKKNLGRFPAQVKAPVQYGSGVRSFATILGVKYQLSHQNIGQLFEDLFGYSINPSTALSAQKQADQACQPLVGQIEQALLRAATIHGDETGIRIDKNREWLHVLSNDEWTYLYIHQNRGRKAIQEVMPQLYDFKGVLVHDCWASYFSIQQAQHALCIPHILRELTALIEQGSQWASKMHRLLMQLYQKYKAGKQINKQAYEWRRYSQLLKQAIEEEPDPIINPRGKPKKSKGRNLADRLVKHKESVLRFALQQGVPFSNNQAERDLRPIKGKLKIAGCFRTWNGANHYARLQSVFSSWKKQGYHIFKELKAILDGQYFHFGTATT